MTFEIQWTGHQGAAMTHRATPVEAIRFAIEMLGQDFTDVVIVDLNEGGKTYTLHRCQITGPSGTRCNQIGPNCAAEYKVVRVEAKPASQRGV
jgi:hypothetical protein